MGKIVVFDSGFGGLTVLSELRRLMPGEEYIYYGDSANAPYGEKSKAELERLTDSICRRLSESYDVKCFVIACNTTTSEAWEYLTGKYSGYDFIGTEPALKWAADENPGSRILVLGTTATINGSRLRARYGELKEKADITLLAAPMIVPYVECQYMDKGKFMAKLSELLKPYRGNVDCVVLGCTHFPFVADEIRQCLEPDDIPEDGYRARAGISSVAMGKDSSKDKIRFYDAAVLVARETRELLKKRDRLAPEGSVGSVVFLNSDSSRIKTEEQLFNIYNGRNCRDNSIYGH